jgi:hypothetical protein
MVLVEPGDRIPAKQVTLKGTAKWWQSSSSFLTFTGYEHF